MKNAWVLVVAGVLLGSVADAAPKTEAEKARAKAEKKLEAFTKEYDPSKKLARKGDELEKDIAALDKELDALTAVDAAAGAELKAKRDTAVASAKSAVGGAAAGQAGEDFEKKLAKVAKDFDPEKKNLASIDTKGLEKAKKELDELIAKLDEGQRAAAQGKRDELVASIERGMGDAKTGKLRKDIAAATPVAPAPGVEAIAPMKPTWCDGVLESYGSKLDNQRPASPTQWSGKFTEGIIFSCLDPDFDVRQQVMAAYRQTMSNALGLTAAQNEQLLQLGAKLLLNDNAKDRKDLQRAVCDEQLKPVESDAVQRAQRSLERLGVGCNNGRSFENRARLIDLDTPGAFTSQLAMASFVHETLGMESAASGEASLYSGSDVAVLNLLPFDAAAFETQLSALKLNELGEAKARAAFFGARARLGSLVSTYKSLAPKVPGLQKAVFDGPAEAAKKKPDPKLLELVIAMESQPGPIKGCAQKLWPFATAELKPQLKAKLEDVRLSGLLAWALTECAARDADAPAMWPIFVYFAERTPAVRGPLTAAWLAYVDAYNESGAAAARGGGGGFDPGKRGGAPAAGPLALAQPRRNPVGQAAFSANMFGDTNPLNPTQKMGGGVVKTVENKGASVRFTFKTETFTVPDYACVETNRIDRIADDGRIIYRQQCTKTGEHQETSTIEPIEVPAFAAAGVAAGSFVVPYWMPINSSAPGRAFIVEAYESKAQAKRTSLFGVAP